MPLPVWVTLELTVSYGNPCLSVCRKEHAQDCWISHHVHGLEHVFCTPQPSVSILDGEPLVPCVYAAAVYTHTGTGRRVSTQMHAHPPTDLYLSLGLCIYHIKSDILYVPLKMSICEYVCAY